LEIFPLVENRIFEANQTKRTLNFPIANRGRILFFPFLGAKSGPPSLHSHPEIVPALKNTQIYNELYSNKVFSVLSCLLIFDYLG